MPVGGPGPYQLRTLSARLREAGSEGQGLRRELMKQINEAAKPLAREISDAAHLHPYMPDRYADILATDLRVSAVKSFARNPGVSIRAKARAHRRKVALLDSGVINHPVFARGDRRTWTWKNNQTGGMRPGFFSDPCEKATPQIRERVLQAMTATGSRITS